MSIKSVHNPSNCKKIEFQTRKNAKSEWSYLHTLNLPAKLAESLSILPVKTQRRIIKESVALAVKQSLESLKK